MKIISKNKSYKISVGIDIGSSKICCAIGQTNNSNTKIKLLGLAITKSSGIKKGVVTDRDKLIETIEKVLIDAEIKFPPCLSKKKGTSVPPPPKVILKGLLVIINY